MGDQSLSRFQLLVGLTGLAFTIITAGVGLMQAYYTALAIAATRGTGITEADYRILAHQYNILFPIGQALLIIGLAIIFSVLVQSLSYGVSLIRSSKGLGAIVLVIVVSFVVYLILFHFETYSSLLSDLAIHQSMGPLFFMLSAVFTYALHLDSKSRTPTSNPSK